MMQFEDNIKNIRKLYQTLTGKDADVILTYKGTSFGIVKVWNLRIDNREINHENYLLGADELMNTLKEELEHKIAVMELQAVEYRKTLSSFAN